MPYFSSNASVVSPADPGTRIPAEPNVLAPCVIFPYRSGISSSTDCSVAICVWNSFFFSSFGVNETFKISFCFAIFSQSALAVKAGFSNSANSIFLGHIACVFSRTICSDISSTATSCRSAECFPIQMPYTPPSMYHACSSSEKLASCFCSIKIVTFCSSFGCKTGVFANPASL